MSSSIRVPEAVKPCAAPTSLRLCDMKAEHLKNRGNAAMKGKNYREAADL